MNTGEESAHPARRRRSIPHLHTRVGGVGHNDIPLRYLDTGPTYSSKSGMLAQ
jgi:hypothetical protein